MESNLSAIINNKVIEEANKNYWLVRTYSGEYFDSFRDHNFIGIGWNEINLSDINKLPSEDAPLKGVKRAKGVKEKRKNILETLALKVNFSSDKEFANAESKLSAGVRAIHQIETFIREIKKGDVVIIPSENSDYYCFGEIEETPVFLADSMERLNTSCELIKRKKIKWIKLNVPRHRLDPNYFRFLRVQSTINNLSDYRYYIEKTISDSFVMDGLSHFVLNVTREDDINPRHYGALLKAIELTELLIFDETGERIGEVEIKASVQSAGAFVIVSQYLPYAFYFAIIVTGIVGGGVALKKYGFNFGTQGFIGGLLQIRNNKTNRVEYERNQEQLRRNQETVRTILELNPHLVTDCEKIVLKLIDNPSLKGLPSIREDNEIDKL